MPIGEAVFQPEESRRSDPLPRVLFPDLGNLHRRAIAHFFEATRILKVPSTVGGSLWRRWSIDPEVRSIHDGEEKPAQVRVVEALPDRSWVAIRQRGSVHGVVGCRVKLRLKSMTE